MAHLSQHQPDVTHRIWLIQRRRPVSDSSSDNSVTPVGDTEAVAATTSTLLGIPRSGDTDRERVVALERARPPDVVLTTPIPDTRRMGPCPHIEDAVLWNAPTQYLGL